MIELIPTETLEHIDQEAIAGDYTQARELVEQELARRTEAILKLGTTVTEYFVPVDPMDDLQCEGCQ